MATAASSNVSLTLTGGLVVSLAALQLLWSLKDRQCIVKQADNGRLFVGPRHSLTDLDLERIREHKAELLALVCYVETVQ